MGKTNYFRLFAMAAFVALGAFSCKWTADSLYMWHPDLKLWGAWLIAIMSFVVASLCFSRLLKSLDRNEDFYGKLFGRTGAFLIGLFGLLFFWVCVSLPTNTHTLLYGSSVKTVMTQDLTRTKGYLTELKDNNRQINAVDTRFSQLQAQVASQLQSMQDEIKHPSHEGIGYRFNSIVTNVEKILSVAIGKPITIQRVERAGSNPREWNRTYEFYQAAILGHLDTYKRMCETEKARIRETMNSDELKNKIINIERALADINDMKGVNHDVIESASNDLTKSYAFIKANAASVDFKTDEDRERYTAEFPRTDAETLLNVQEVISDFFKSERYKGLGYWILIAILVDVAGFVFFNISFNSKNNNAIV